MTKSFDIPKRLVWDAFQRVKANGGAAGVDKESIEDFERDLRGNLYKIWNRMSAGSCFPPPVKSVMIPKKGGGQRRLGVPTVADRVAQTVAKMVLEPMLEPVFDRDSFGYRPGRSALDAVALVRRRCWKYDWVVEFDIKGLFDNIDHSLLLRALKRHCKVQWVIMYVQRWMTAPLLDEDGSLVPRDRGTPQGGVISPLLANLFLHYVLDAWMCRAMRSTRFCRYADDGVVHCKSEAQARFVGHLLARERWGSIPDDEYVREAIRETRSPDESRRWNRGCGSALMLSAALLGAVGAGEWGTIPDEVSVLEPEHIQSGHNAAVFTAWATGLGFLGVGVTSAGLG